MISSKNIVFIGTILVLSTVMSSCLKEVFIPAEVIDITGWMDETHSNSVDPNYDIVFNQDKVNRMDIVLTDEEYNTMQDDLSEILSSASGGGPGGGTISIDETPVYVGADIYFNDVQWFNVGVRYKGNSSLLSTYNQGIGKLPLRLKFDHFEDDYPEIADQRFYGFQHLSMSSNYNDKTFMREKAAADVFKEFGVPAPRTAFYEVYLDHGNGPEYLGLYTMVEVVFDSMLDDVFGSNSGNCYKPEGDGAMFSSSNFNISDFEKKTNEIEGDWSDIQELYDVLHSSSRTSDLEAWKSSLETIFDVAGFLKYLAVNNTIQNWDTYGNMTHNYYLYHDPQDDLIKWVVWDNNEAFQSTGRYSPLSFEMSEVNDDWPLISYIVDVPEYRSMYDNYLSSFVEGVFEPNKMSTQYDNYNNLIYESATSEVAGNSFISSPSDYTSALSTLKSHASSRTSAAQSYLD